MATDTDLQCGECGGTYRAIEGRIFHREGCSRADRPAGTVSSLDAARFNRTTEPDKLNPRTALVAALEWLDEEVAAGRPVTHVIVMTGRDAPDHPAASGTRFFQAGTYRHHSQMGLCLEGMEMIRDSGK